VSALSTIEPDEGVKEFKELTEETQRTLVYAEKIPSSRVLMEGHRKTLAGAVRPSFSLMALLGEIRWLSCAFLLIFC